MSPPAFAMAEAGACRPDPLRVADPICSWRRSANPSTSAGVPNINAQGEAGAAHHSPADEFHEHYPITVDVAIVRSALVHTHWNFVREYSGG
ncbi:hypothetical protein YTPLAS18_19100 [Nitrospira sp.]|nr:hypothetical protein YTPLAS18_19100 [Nitrospira sp.]